MIHNSIKQKCVALVKSGTKLEDVYNEYIKPYSAMTLDSFARRIREWRYKVECDEQTLDAANLAYKFQPYAATVQVNKNGEMIQAWVRQQTEDKLGEILEAIKDNTPVAKIQPKVVKGVGCMLETPFLICILVSLTLRSTRRRLERLSASFPASVGTRSSFRLGRTCSTMTASQRGSLQKEH